MDKILFNIISITILYKSTFGLEISCEFYEDDYDPCGEFYSCVFEGVPEITSENIEVTFNGDHINSTMTNNNVRAVKTDYHRMMFFPQSMEKTFKNLEAIYINDGPLSKITKQNLKPFPNLVFLDLYDNKLQVVESDLFINNLKLKLIFLANNNIYEIHPNVFDNLKSLRYLYLSGNQCVGRSAKEGNLTELMDLVREIKVDCIPGRIITTTTDRLKTLNVSDSELEQLETHKQLKEIQIKLEHFVHLSLEYKDKIDFQKENIQMLKNSISKYEALVFILGIVILVMSIIVIVWYKKYGIARNGPIVRMNPLII